MANPPPNPANSNFNISLPPPSISSQSSAPFTPRSTSFADDSDAEFDPTPLHSPRGGPEYDDLPPSYDEARHQAVSDARQGVAPLDPNQIEAHRLTLNEGPNEPEIWEYRIRGEEVGTEHEQAPEYSNITNNHETTVPVQHVETSTTIPVGITGKRISSPDSSSDRIADLLRRALEFTRHEPDADAQYAPRLARRIAIPQQITSRVEQAPVQFLRAYSKALHAHSIQPAEFTEFLDGLNALCVASGSTIDAILSPTSATDATLNLVYNYIQSTNEVFFMPRGLRVSLRSLSSLVDVLAIPTERGQRADAIASALDNSNTVERRAQALHPWAEAIDTDVPASSTQSLLLREMAEPIRRQGGATQTCTESSASQVPAPAYEDPPHSSLEDMPGDGHENAHDSHPSHGRGRGGHRGRRGGPWSPFGVPDRGPFGAAGNGPFGAPSNGPFGPPGNGPFGHPANGPFGRGGRGPRGHRGRGAHGPDPRGLPGYDRSRGAGPGNDWAVLGQNLGKLGEQFGKRMGDWGQQFGKQAEIWGQGVGQRAANPWNADLNARNNGSSSQQGPAPYVDDAMPPSYDEGPSSQETGVLRGDSKTSQEPPAYDDTKYDQHVKNGKDVKSTKDYGDDASSISSDSSDSDSDLDSDSDTDDDDLPDAQATFLKRMASINKAAESSAQKGKKSASEIASERALAIGKAEAEREATQVKIAEKLSKREMRRTLKQKQRDLKREHKHTKRELRQAHGGKGKGKKAKKSPEWKQAKKEYRAKKKELRKEKLKVRQEWREARAERMRERREARRDGGELEEGMDRMVWVVIENIND
jgi:hypothetical protein